MADKPAAVPGRRMIYPYGNMGKLLYFPWKHHWKHGRGLRFLAYSLILSLPVFYQINKFVNSPGNVEEWKRIREARKHDPFAVPTEHPTKHH